MKTGKKISGGRYHKPRKRKKTERLGKVRLVKLGDDKKKKLKKLGGKKKTVMLTAKMVNVMDQKKKKAKRVKILNVLETPHNKFLARQNRLSKGTIIETELGKARVTNRPSQEGSVHAVLLQ
jgi:small subunit ribosomal protein S8e